MPALAPEKRPAATAFEVRHRAPGGRWKVLATVGTRREAVALMNGSGEWYFPEVAAKRTAPQTPGLFDEPDEPDEPDEV